MSELAISYDGQHEPTRVGVYACRVDDLNMPGFHKDEFLMFIDGRWWYLFSDQRYRGHVHGFVGPIPRTRG